MKRAGQTSAKVPSIWTALRPPQKPAKKRQTASWVKVREKTAPRVKALSPKVHAMYGMLRPNRSLTCGPMMGAKAMPKMYSEKPEMAVVMDTSNSFMTPARPEV